MREKMTTPNDILPTYTVKTGIDDVVYSIPLDPGIARYVHVLRQNNVETFESCQGGDGHPCPEPMVRFHGGQGAGFVALGIALTHGFRVSSLRRFWSIQDGEPNGPHWEMTFCHLADSEAQSEAVPQ